MKMNINRLNLNGLRIFLVVYQSGSMTTAATQLHLTQSGVSQHIHSLEEELGKTLFTRLPRKIIPTSVAHEIYGAIHESFINLERRLAKVLDVKTIVAGQVRIGMPIEFGTNIVVPLLSQLGLKNPGISFEITLDYTSVLQEKLLKNELDFAFIDEAPKDNRISYQAVGSEKILLCTTPQYLSKHTKVVYTSSYFESLDYVEYKGDEPILRRWMLHHLKRKNLKLNVRAHIMDVQGVAKFITSGLGVGALPDHVVDKIKHTGQELKIFEGKSKPLENEIRLAKLKKHPLSSACQLTLNELMQEFLG